MKILCAIIWFLLIVAFTSGYIVGAAQQSPKRPTESCTITEWGFIQETPHTLRTDI